MRTTFTAKQFQLSDGLRIYGEKKVGKLERFFKTEPDASVTLSMERDRQTAEVTLRSGGMIYRASETTGDMYASIDSAVNAIERQIRKNKTRLAKRLREGAFDVGEAAPQAEEPEEDTAFDVVRSKKFSIKPMTVEEAILQMNLLGHQFFAFRNQNEGNAFSIVYRRNNGGYGLIESGDEE